MKRRNIDFGENMKGCFDFGVDFVAEVASLFDDEIDSFILGQKAKSMM